MEPPSRTLFARLQAVMERLGTSGGEPEELRVQKTLLVASACMMSLGGLSWGAFLLAYDEMAASTVPFGYTALTIVNIGVYRLFGNYRSFRWLQLMLTLLLPFLLGLQMGGYASSGAVVAWSLLAPMGALLFCTRQEATWWFVAFVAVLCIAGLLETTVQGTNNLEGTGRTVFFVMNLAVPTLAAFIMLRYFVTRVAERTAALEQANRDLQDAQAQLVHQGQMASIGRLAAGVAHELNTPIASITSSQDTLSRAVQRTAQLLAEDGAPTRVKKLDGMLQAIVGSNAVIGEAAGRVDEITRRLRAFANLDEAELREVNINEGIVDTITLLGGELGDTPVQTELGELPLIAVYPGALNQVFLNLLRNARQAIDGDGTISVRSYLSDEVAVVEVRDDGRGIPQDRLPTLFEPRFTTRDNRVAVSMGLSIGQRIMQQHGGSIEYSTEPGKGTTFTLRLPLDLPRRIRPTATSRVR